MSGNEPFTELPLSMYLSSVVISYHDNVFFKMFFMQTLVLTFNPTRQIPGS